MAVVTNYTTLQTAIGDELARSDLSTFIPNFLQKWEDRFYRQPQNYGYWMETTFTATIASNVAVLPSDFLGMRVCYVSGQNATPLVPVSLEKLLENYPRSSSSGLPRWFARVSTDLWFGPVPDSAYTIAGVYYAKPPLLRDDADGINWLITHAVDLVLYGSLLEAETFLKNDYRVQLWGELYKEALFAYRDLMKNQNGGRAPQVQLG